MKDASDAWDCNVKANKAILELTHHGNGPVHINLTTTYSPNFQVKKLQTERKIERIMVYDKLPDMPQGKIAVYVGSHVRMSKVLTESIDTFVKHITLWWQSILQPIIMENIKSLISW